ncbi:hypothetical protein OH77DRAFT_306107 [Trametes cingulata]|nr:hypothetical protein OH77DRAFT_306107 [Trametes cingulata]
MSAHPSPPPNQGATDFESDSEYLGTPIDPPSAGQPHVADNGPLGDYYYPPAHYGSAEYAPGQAAMPQYRYSDSGFVGMPGQQSLLLGQNYYETAVPNDCGRPADSTMSSYHCPDGLKEEPSIERSGPSLVAAGCAEGARQQCPPGSAQYPEFDGDPVVYGDGVQNLSSYSIARSRQPDLVCDTVSRPQHIFPWRVC